jgi:phosphoribosylformylglycinamidine synthase
VLLLGSAAPGLAGSAYAALAGGAAEDGPPSIDLGHEAVLQRTLLAAAAEGLLASAQDVSGGGLAVAAAECAMWAGIGARLQLPVGSAPAVDLFGESPGRVLVSASPDDWERLAGLAAAAGLAVRRLGTVAGRRLVIELLGDGATGAAEGRGAGVADALDVALADLEHAWRAALPRALGDDVDVAGPPPDRGR